MKGEGTEKERGKKAAARGRIEKLHKEDGDITARKRAEQALQRERNLLRLMINNLPDKIFVKDNNGRFIIANEKVVRYEGMKSEEDLIGKIRSDLIHPDDLEQGFSILKEGFKTGEERVMEGRFKHKDGHYIWLEVKGKSFQNNEGHKKGLLIARDITERKSAKQKLKDSEEHFRKTFENLSDVISIMGLDGK